MLASGTVRALIGVVLTVVIAASASAQGGEVALTSIRHETLADSQRVILELEGEVAFHDERLEKPARVFIDLKNTRVSSDLKDTTHRFPDGWVRQIRIGYPQTRTTRVVLDLRGAPKYSVYNLNDPYRIVVDVEAPVSAAPVEAGVEPPPEPVATNGKGNVSLSRQLGLGVSRVVIDAGHGGHDAGARVNGLNEADLTLDVALRLEQLLVSVP